MVFKKNSKRAFGDVASTLILFIAVISVTTGIVIMFKNYVADTEQAFSRQNDLNTQKLKTSISVSHVYYNTTSGKIYVYVKNIGETQLVMKNFNVFIDANILASYNATYATNVSKVMRLFNPQDTLLIYLKYPLSSGTHTIRLVSEYGVGTKESFNI